MIVQQARQDRTEKNDNNRARKKKVLRIRIRNPKEECIFFWEVGEFECLEIVIHCLL